MSEGNARVDPSPRHSNVLVDKTVADFANAPDFMKTLTRGIAGEETPDEAAREAAWNRVASPTTCRAP